ncbi:MAG: type II secretion system F family protein [Sedimentisphaerales bacterium]|nr:type II secretion system F family protein [Sedimentisphaerales bacterium]
MASKTELAQAYYDLAVMLDAGIPILRSLDIVIQGRRGHIKQVFSRIRESLSQGSSLAESMEKQRNVFPDMDRMLIDAAETSGSLHESFKMLSQWHEFICGITRRIRMQLIYPMFVLHFGALIYGLPDLILGRITTWGYVLMVVRMLLLFYVPAAIILLMLRLRERAPAIRVPFDFLALRIPILGTALYHLSVCRYARAFSMLYKAGVPITETTERATRATGNAIVAGLFKGGSTSVRQGGMAWEGFSKRLPAEYLQLWQIGEESGELDRTVDKVAEISADRADLWFKAFGFWAPWFVYACIAAILIRMIFKLAAQAYGPLLNFNS